MKHWLINVASLDPRDGSHHPSLCVGLTTKEWIVQSGDEERPGDATTFMWVVLVDDQLIEIGFRPHDSVTEEECLAQVPPLLRLVRAHGDNPVKTLLGRELR